MFMCRVFSCVVERGCMLWPVCSLGRTLLAFALLHSVLQGQICVLLLVILDSYFCIPVPYNENDTFWGCFIKALAGLHRTVQLQLLWYYWSWHRLGLLWYWMVCLGNKQRSFCHFWDCIHVFHPSIASSLYVSPDLKSVSCKQHIYRSCFCIHSATQFILIWAFNLYI